jgi:hypothetical protein
MKTNRLSKNIGRALAIALLAVMAMSAAACATSGSNLVTMKNGAIDGRVIRASDYRDRPEHSRG